MHRHYDKRWAHRYMQWVSDNYSLFSTQEILNVADADHIEEVDWSDERVQDFIHDKHFPERDKPLSLADWLYLALCITALLVGLLCLT